VDGGSSSVIDRRRISVQWFSGTILTGVCGAALMGGAVFASLDGETNFATIPERVGSALRGAIGEIGEKLTRKADRLPPAGDSTGSRQLIRISVTTKIGDREVVRVRPYYRVSANLALASTEYAGSGPWLDNHETGIYRCVCCDTALFHSDHKYESGTGWPSFFQPISKHNVSELTDKSYGMIRTAVNCARCDGHLGHVFDDGPKPTGLRYCMNGVSLTFKPASA